MTTSSVASRIGQFRSWIDDRWRTTDDFRAVTHSRFLVLTLGPIAVISAAYVVAFPRAFTAEVSPLAAPLNKTVSPDRASVATDLPGRCEQAAEGLKQKLAPEFHLVVRPPFVLAGDIPALKLRQLHDEIVAPVSRALRSTYFKRAPNQPITIVICATEARFRQLAQEWDGHLDGGYHGYYQRDKRRVLLDLGAGNGSLAHELTHALTQSDCEDLPEWFDEGLAALHEDATFSARENGLIGLPNWRCRITQQALKTSQLPSSAELTRPREFRTGNVELRYAMSRSLCLFLQDERLLAKFYKDLRERNPDDISGIQTLCRVLNVDGAVQFDRRFHQWLRNTMKPRA